jgi:hypothetical protein
MKRIAVFLLLLAVLALLPACNMPSWSTYTNVSHHFQLQYPSGGSVVTDTPNAARIQLPIAPGTNLVEKYLDISAVTGAIPCLSPYSDSYSPPGSLVVGNETINGNYFVIERASEGAAGSFYTWVAYSISNGIDCVSLTFVLHSHNPGVYATPPATFDLPTEKAVFDFIVASFTWLEQTPTPVSSFTPTPVVSFTPTHPVPSGWLTYLNLAYGFRLDYPSGGGGLQPGDTAVAARIDLPFAPGTNLTEKYLAIEVTTPDASHCGAPYAGGPTPVPVTLTIGGLPWTQQNGGEGAMGSIYLWTTYSTISGSVCVNLSFILHSHPTDLWPTPPPAYDEAGESAVFLHIVETFVWLSGAAVTPTPVYTWTPTSVYTSTPTPVYTWTPTPAAFAYTPHLNAYCRFGPDPVFDSLDVAMKGQTYLIDGQDAAHAWFRILLEPNKYCWVLQSTGSATGDLSKLRVLLSPPTPTPTLVPIDCSSYTDKKACNAVRACTWYQINDRTGVCNSK